MQTPRVPVKTEAAAQYGEVEGRIVVVHVSHTSHGDEWQVMEEPTDHGIDPGVVEMVDLSPGEFVEASLPADGVPCAHAKEEDEGEGGAPVDDRVAEEEVFDNVVVPSAHAKSNVEERPLPWFRCQVILFIWVWNQGVVGSHHGHVQVDEVAEERGLVRARVASWDCKSLANEQIME